MAPLNFTHTKRCGVSNYHGKYEKLFMKNLTRYASLKKRIRQCVEQVLENPYSQTEFLGDLSGKLNLKGCRSVRVDRNFRIVFVICEECRDISQCEYCFCDDLSEDAIVFLTVGPHDKAYSIK